MERQFIRHPSDIPIEVTLGELVADEKDYLNNISFGGLSFKAKTRVRPGEVITIRIPLVAPSFEVSAKVKWCKKRDEFFDVGVVFSRSDDAFHARMVEQVCYIEHYKREVLETQGRSLSSEEAALEWISRFAEHFPSFQHDE